MLRHYSRRKRNLGRAFEHGQETAGARTDLATGDVRYVEDSLTKHRDLARVTTEFAGADKVDTRDTDFFGRNATGAVDSILVRV